MKKIKKLFWAEENGHVCLAAVLMNVLLVAVLWVMLFWVSLHAIQVQLDFSFLGQFRVRVWDGFLVTLRLSLCSLILSFFIGVRFAYYKIFLQCLCKIYPRDPSDYADLSVLLYCRNRVGRGKPVCSRGYDSVCF